MRSDSAIGFQGSYYYITKTVGVISSNDQEVIIDLSKSSRTIFSDRHNIMALLADFENPFVLGGKS